MPTYRQLRVQQVAQLTKFDSALSSEIVDIIFNSDITKEDKFRQIKYFLMTYGKNEDEVEIIIKALF
jgi:hypothetical protein